MSYDDDDDDDSLEASLPNSETLGSGIDMENGER